MKNKLIEFVSETTSIRKSKITLDSRLLEDFRIAGDDGKELIESFGREFGVDVSKFDSESYFGKESSNPFMVIKNFIFPRQEASHKAITVNDLLIAIHDKRLQ
jgi:hypothetical protein